MTDLIKNNNGGVAEIGDYAKVSLAIISLYNSKKNVNPCIELSKILQSFAYVRGTCYPDLDENQKSLLDSVYGNNLYVTLVGIAGLCGEIKGYEPPAIIATALAQLKLSTKLMSECFGKEERKLLDKWT